MSDGRVLTALTAESSATFAFTGTGITWTSVLCDECGFARVSIDGGAPR